MIRLVGLVWVLGWGRKFWFDVRSKKVEFNEV